MDALETVTLEVVVFLIASVCVTLFPMGTVPKEIPEGVEVNDAACALPGRLVNASNATETANHACNQKACNEKCRREGPPGWTLFKKVCWKTRLKRFWRAKNQNPYKFIPQLGYGPRFGGIY